MKFTEITNRSDAELKTLVAEQRRALRDAIIEARTKEVKNVKAQAALKRTIARALTVQRQREIQS